MNDKNRRRYEACKRCVQWAIDYAAGLPGAGAIVTKFAALAAKVNEIEALAGAQMTAIGESGQEFDQKGGSREDLIDPMTRVANAARAAEPDFPGIQARFRFRRNLNDADLLAKSRSFIEAENDFSSIIEEYGGGTSWVADLTAAADAFEAAINEASSAVGSRSATTAQINQAVAEAMQLKRTCGFLVPNYLGDDVGAMAAWQTAAHVENAPSTPTPPTP